MIAVTIPPETLQQAKADGATHFSALYEEFYRPVGNSIMSTTWQHCRVWEDGSLGKWIDDWRSCPPESAVRL